MFHEYDPTVPGNDPGAGTLASIRAASLNSLHQTGRPFFTTSDPRIRAHSPLPDDVQTMIDSTIQRTQEESLGLRQAVSDAGLIVPLPNWLSVLSIDSDAINDVGEAKQTMELDVRYERSVQDIARRRIPIFATWEAVDFGHRLLQVADRAGWPLQTNHVAQATRNVDRKLEQQFLQGLRTRQGTSFKIDGNDAPGILSSQVNTYEFIDSEAWTADGHSGEDIEDDIDAMANLIADSSGGNFAGPFMLVVGTLYNNKLNKRFVNTYDSGTIRSNLLEKDYGGQLKIVRTARMPADYVALVQLSSNVIDMIVGQGPQSYSWRTSNHQFAATATMIVACEILRVHETYEGHQGIVVGYKDPL